MHYLKNSKFRPLALAIIVSLVAAPEQRAAPLATGPGSADVGLDVGLHCDPTCSDVLGVDVTNGGPDVATNVVLTFEVPGDVRFYDLIVESPHRVTRPGYGEAGLVTVEFQTLPVGHLAGITAYFSTPLDEGWHEEVEFAVRASELDPELSNNSLRGELFTPYRPVVTAIRELRDPYRLELLGRSLQIGPFGSVAIGNCEPAYYPQAEDDPRGERLILSGGSELRRQFPVGEPVRIFIVNSGGGALYTHYTRKRR